MKITVNNIDRKLRVELSQLCEIVGVDDRPSGAFIQWVTPDVDDLFSKQTKLIEKCVKLKIPMIVFDKQDNLSPDEVSYLLSNGAFLWEPAVTGRNFFSFQPNWGTFYTDFKDLDLIDATKKNVHLTNCSSLVRKFPSFEKYYVPVHEIGEFNVMYSNSDGNDAIYQKVEKLHIPILNTCNYRDIRATILLGSERDYETGYLDPNLFRMLESGILPLLPEEHRWYHGVFADLVVSGEDDIDYLLRTYDKIAFGSIYDIYCNLDAYLPEANVKNVAKRIVKYFS